MENISQRRRLQNSGGAASPRLIRSKSETTIAAPPETRPSTSRPRASKEEEKPKTSTRIKTPKKEDHHEGGGFIMFAPRTTSKLDVPRRTRSASTSPSAWALSPGRSLPCSSPAPVPKHPSSSEKFKKAEAKSGGGGVSGVLKYFSRQNKVSPVLEEEYHRFRVVYNRLLQWRFANARGEAAMTTVTRLAQKKLFNVWARICATRNYIVEKRAKIDRLKHEMKLLHIFQSQMKLLNEWSRLEPRNVEAVSRVLRKLSALSFCLPLVQNAEGDIASVSDAMSNATVVMDDIQATILNMHRQVEQTCFLLTELSVMLKEQNEFLKELENGVTMVAWLEVQEKSLRVHHFQLTKEDVVQETTVTSVVK